MDRKLESVVLENVQIIFRNFAGLEGQYNRAGDRNFAVLLEEDVAERMEADGWNIKRLRAREEGEQPQAYLSVSVSYKGRPPRVVLVTGKGRSPLLESEVELMDWVDLKYVDVILNPYSWSVSGKSGIKAYLKTLMAVVQEDALEIKYQDLPELGAAPPQLAIESYQDAEIVED